MKRETKLLVARLIFLVTERGLRDQQCACRRPLVPLLTPDIQKAIDALEEALAQEPEAGRGAYLEID